MPLDMLSNLFYSTSRLINGDKNMTQSKHTPSPWSLEKVGDDFSVVNREHEGDDWDIATVHSTEANARLIAAAPELLEALEIMLKYAESYLAPSDGPIFETARAAIAKARGK